MVKSTSLYSPQNYLEAVTGKCYLLSGDDDISAIEQILAQNDMTLWNYPLTEIDHIVENELDVVLVECCVWNEEASQYSKELRWFEVPEGFVDDKEEDA